MVGGTIMAYLGGLHYWWPKISGRLYNEWLGRRSARRIIFIGFNLTFFPQFIVGYLGMPRRYHAYPPEFQVLNVLSSAGASILGVGYLLPMIYLDLVAALRPHRRLEPVGRGRPRVDHDVAAADRELRRNAGRHLGRLRVSDARWRVMLPERGSDHRAGGSRIRRSRTTSTTSASRQEAATLGMWVFLVTEVLFFGGLFAAYSVYRGWYPDAFAAASLTLDVPLGDRQHRRPHHQQPDDGAGACTPRRPASAGC